MKNRYGTGKEQARIEFMLFAKQHAMELTYIVFLW